MFLALILPLEASLQWSETQNLTKSLISVLYADYHAAPTVSF